MVVIARYAVNMVAEKVVGGSIVNVLVGINHRAIETIQPVLCAHPHYALLILVKAVHQVIGQSVFLADMVKKQRRFINLRDGRLP